MSALEETLAMQIRLAGLPEPVREWAFAAKIIGRRWRFDFAWLDRMMAVEVEGGIHSGGRHTRGVGFEKDLEKYNAACLLGWAVYRVSGGMVESGEALDLLTRALGEKDQ